MAQLILLAFYGMFGVFASDPGTTLATVTAPTLPTIATTTDDAEQNGTPTTSLGQTSFSSTPTIDDDAGQNGTPTITSFSSTPSIGPISDACCFYSIVDRVPYILVEENADTNGYECNPKCLYQRFDDPKSRFCPSNGEMKLVDLDFFFLCKDELKNLLDGVEKNMDTLEYGLCDGTIGSCFAGKCAEIFDSKIQCLRPVLDLSDKAHCSAYAGYGNVGLNSGYCKNFPQCPTDSSDNHCNCCKYKHYGSVRCKKNCKCEGTCSYLALRGYCQYKACCECPTFNTKCKKTSCPNPPPPLEVDPISLEHGDDDDNPVDDALSQCDEICQHIVDKTGYGKHYPWNTCKIEYAFCCECRTTDSNYGVKCPDFCHCDKYPTQQAFKITEPSTHPISPLCTTTSKP